MSIVSDRIKERRLACGKTLLQVADYLGVKEATAQRYESGTIKTIKYEIITSLSELFNCNPAYLMGWLNSPTSDERVIAPPPLSPNLQSLSDALDQLNDEGQEKLVDYADDLVSSGKYKKYDTSKLGRKEA